MKRRKQRAGRRGAAMVEMALVLPVFITVVLGIIEFGRAMMVAQLVTNAAREGARLAIVGGTTESDVTTRVNDFLTQAADVGAEYVTVAVNITPGAGNPTPASLSDCQEGDLITVSVSVPFDQVNYIPGNHLAGRALQGEASMRHE